MTTPKEPIEFEFYLLGLARGSAVFDPKILDAAAIYIRKGVAAKRELAEEFRRLAAEASERGNNAQTPSMAAMYGGQWGAFKQAAQMLEERLNG